MNRDELTLAVRTWLETTPGAGDAAEWLLDRAAAGGEIPKEPTLDAGVPWRNALESLLSARFVRLSDQGQKLTVWFDRWEREQFGASGVLLPVLAAVRGRPIVSRRQQRQQRETRIRELLQKYSGDEGLPGHVARSELAKLELHQGRFWSRSSRWATEETDREVRRYFKLLCHVEGLRRDSSRIERIVHVSRVVAGDTHWLRPRNRIWHDLAGDVLDLDADLKARLDGLERREGFGRALGEVGIVENLTSVVVLVYGYFELQRGDASWRWPEEAAQRCLPIWLSAVHLNGCQIVPDAALTSVISVENETSFLDLIEAYGDDPSVVLVYTEGQANRAVVRLLRLLSDAAPTARFQHQGDLDLPGVRILASLAVRTGLRIQPTCMDAETHRRFAASGIPLTAAEVKDVLREIAFARLPCQDLLEQIAASGMRIEQELITAQSPSAGLRLDCAQTSTRIRKTPESER
jgi:hypothetical protein